MSQHYTSGRQGQGSRRRNNRQGRYSQGGEYRGSKGKYRNSNTSAQPKEKLSFWQKLLRMIGFNKAPLPKKEAIASGKTAKTNIRIARPKTEGRAPISKQPVSSPRLYVGNLSYEATESDLEDLFKGIGTVRSVEIIYNPRTHKSKGYAFVEMQFMDDAKRSVEVLHDQPFMGRLMTVSAANERQDTPNDRSDRGDRNDRNNDRGDRSERNERVSREQDQDEVIVQPGVEEKVYSLGGNA